MKIFVKAFGCSSSFADAEVLKGCLIEANHTIVENPRLAEILIYNTCAVKGPTENRIIDKLRKTPQEKKLVVAGCLPLVNLERLEREVRCDGFVGPAFGFKIIDVVDQIAEGLKVTALRGSLTNIPNLNSPRVPFNKRISIIPISYGCRGSCAYCCVRFARGELRSYSINEIVERVKKDLSNGFQEIWLTSQDTSCYGKDRGTNLAILLDKIRNINGDFLIRIGMMTPNNLLQILNGVIEAFKDKRVFKFLHLPVQSGDDKILKRMNRYYTTDDFTDLVSQFRRVFPKITIWTDVIVGFPGESKKAFMNSCELIKKVKPDVVNVSKFFGRPHTPASTMKQKVAQITIKKRSRHIAKLVRQISLEKNSSWKGWQGEVFFDEVGKLGSIIGRNFAYKPIVVKTPAWKELFGKKSYVKIVRSFQSHLLGELHTPNEDADNV